jgi:hypothetical protein
VRTTIRAAAIDTGAIESLYKVDRGFTHSVAVMAQAWEAQIEQRGPDVRALFDAQLAAYENALDVATSSRPVTEAWIRSLYAQVTAAQATHRVLAGGKPQDQPFAHGEYKRLPNHPWNDAGLAMAYAPVLDTPQEMQRLVKELQGRLSAESNPAVQAAYAHYALVRVHPFADGNGRVARALASTNLFRACRVPLLVFAHERERYLDALIAADRGEFGAFNRFIARRAVGAMRMATEAMQFTVPEAPEALGARISGITEPIPGYTFRAIHAKLAELGDIVQQHVAEFMVPISSDHLGFSVDHQPVGVDEQDAYIPGVDVSDNSRMVTVRSPEPADTQTQLHVRLHVLREIDNHRTYRISVPEWNRVMYVDLEDVFPVVSMAVESRVRRFIDSAMTRLLQELELYAKQRLRDRGFTR